MKPSSAPVSAPTGASQSDSAILILGIGLVLARWLVPTEATAEGDTLRLAGAWLLAAAFLGVWAPGLWTRRRWDLADAGVLLLVGGHVVSGLIVLTSAGDRRMAINLLWEWTSLGILWLVWRAALSKTEIRRGLLSAMLVTAVTLAAWGLWQYFVWYPQIKREYLPLIDQFRQVQAAGGDTAGLSLKLFQAGIPTTEPGLTLFLNRLRDSYEPFGPFALANTFGGLLAAWLVMGVYTLLKHGWRTATRRVRWSQACLAAGMLLIGCCLYTTNSRTAWAGIVAALIVGGSMAVAPRISSATVRRAAFPLTTLCAGLVGIASLTIILRDVHAVPGPLKSLAYRAEYWRGTLALLSTAPGWGAGLGQFRDKYLMYKVPESSEEISDPHQMLLDVWANGGATALIGLCLLLGLLWFRIWQSTWQPREAETPGATMPRLSLRRLLILSSLMGFALAVQNELSVGGGWDHRVDLLFLVEGVWLLLCWLLPMDALDAVTDDVQLGLLAAVALSIHLLGAGGIAMPAVTQLWLLALAWGFTPVQNPPAVVSARRWRAGPLIAAGCCLALCVGWYLIAERPVRLAQSATQLGDRQLTQSGGLRSPQKLRDIFQDAAVADPWSPEPWMRLASLAFGQALADRSKIDRAEVSRGIELADAAIARAPFRPALLIQKGDWLRDAARVSNERQDWIAAAEAYHAANVKHPTNAALLADLAICRNRAGEAAAAVESARQALKQDELNHQRGHADRYLPAAAVQQLQAILTDMPE